MSRSYNKRKKIIKLEKKAEASREHFKLNKDNHFNQAFAHILANVISMLEKEIEACKTM